MQINLKAILDGLHARREQIQANIDIIQSALRAREKRLQILARARRLRWSRARR